MLRVDLEDFAGNHRFTTYSTFVVEGESSEYTVRLSRSTAYLGK